MPSSIFNSSFYTWIFILNLLHIFICNRFVHGSYLKDPTKCGKPTCNVDKKFGFMPNMIYTYKYTVNVNTSFDGADAAASSGLMIDAEFELHFSSTCEGILLVKQATFADNDDNFSSENDGTSEDSSLFSNAVMEFPLRFYFDSGIVKEVCPHSNESSWVLNFKKGILSALQNSMKRLDMDHKDLEVDVNGYCNTNYLFDSVNGTTLLITKSKDMSSCTKRYALHSVIPTSTYAFQSEYHRWSPLLSKLDCKQYIDHKVYTEISCREEHSFEPFYNQSSEKLSMTTVDQNIVLINEDSASYSSSDNTLKDIITRRESLLFDHHSSLNLDPKYLQEAENYLKEMCKLDREEFNIAILEDYNKLITAARQLSYENLSQLVKWSSTVCSTGNKHLFQALPHLQTSAAIRVMKDIIMTDNKIPSAVTHEWLIGMALFRRHDAETINTVSSILYEKPDKETQLSVSAMIYSYCRAPGADCENNVIVNDMISFLEVQVKNTCYSYKEFKKGIVGLKALGNAGIFTNSISEILNTCILKDSLPMDVRVAAVEAYRRFSCNNDRNLLLNVYLNQTYDSELRIPAYLEVMKCPTHNIIKAVKELLVKEEVNQVGTFVWSHIQNLLKSSQDTALEIQAILQDEYLSSKFTSDMTKFSQNYESSLYVNEYGTGGFLSSNIIFSHKSYIPQTLMTNFTLYLFGEPVNFFEMSVNVEGFEEYFENIVKSGKLFSLSKIELPLQLLRYIRNTPSRLTEQINSIPNVIKNKLGNTKISAGFKIFGHELVYIDVDGKNKIDELLERLNPLRIFKDFFSGQEVKLDRMGMFLDSTYITPLGVGLPLNLDATGAGAINVNMAGFVNMTAYSSHGLIDVGGKLKPSVAVSLVGGMGVSAFYKQTSIKFKSKFLSSTALEGSFKKENNKLVRMAFNLPKDRSDILNIETEFVSLKGLELIPVKGVSAGLVENKICSWSILDEVLGLKLCTNFLFPNAANILKTPILLIKGPLKFGISVEKSDSSAKKYILEYKRNDYQNKTIITAVFETPGSNVKRIMKASVDLDGQTQNLTLLIQSESNILQAEGSFRWVEKKSISQCDVHINFKTNKFDALLTGYVRTNQASFATNLKIVYKFEKSDQETIKMEFNYSDRTTKYLTKFFGKLQLESTAYPQINFLTSLKYQKAHEHLEYNIEMQTSPFLKDDKNKLYMQLLFASLKTPSGSKVNTYLQVKKPANDIDIKLGFTHEVLLGASNTAVMVRYASGKEIKISLDLKMPRGSMLYLECKFKINLPTAAEPMVVTIHIHEKLTNEYDIDFAGVWFSGHNITIRGMYTDRSTYATMNYNIKLLIKGHLFNDILVSGRLYSSDEEYKIDLQVEHNSIKYVLIMRHFYKRNILIETYGEVQYNSSSYILSNYIDIIKHKAEIELHLDKYRDIHISIHGNNNHSLLDVGCDIKWDANRDPSQKLVFILNLNSLQNFTYKGNMVIEYPGRVINVILNTERKGVNFIGFTKIDWSPDDRIDVSSSLVWDLQGRGIIDFKGTLITPFKGWQSSLLTYRFHWMDYGVMSNASLIWMKDQSINCGLNAIYLVNDKFIDVLFDAGINSSASDIKPMQAKLSHFQTDGKYQTVLILQSSIEHVLRFDSNGYINTTNNITDSCGSIKIKTPFNALSNCQLDVSVKTITGNKLKSNMLFVFNDKSFSTIIKGSFKKLYESQLYFKILTPYENYERLYGRVGYSASKRHVIAEVKGPVSSTGIEVLYVFNNFYDFDMKLHVFTAISFIDDTLFVGKINSENVDFRCGWNKLMVGVTGKARYSTWHDIEYIGIVYLPVEMLSKIGAIVKLIYSDRIDIAASIIAAEKKIGLTVQAMKYPEPNFAKYKVSLIDEETLFAMVENFEDDLVNIDHLKLNERKAIWRGFFELDTGFYRSSRGNIEICFQKADHLSNYDVTCDLDLPIIIISLKDSLQLQNLINMTNELNITSTNDAVKEIVIKYEGAGITNLQLSAKLDGNLLSYNESFDFQLATDYNFHSINEDVVLEGSGRHEINFLAKTPFPAFNSCAVEFVFETDKNTYATDLYMNMSQYKINVGGMLVIEESDFLNSTFKLKIVSPSFNLPICQIHLSKDYTEVEKKVNAFLILPGDSGADSTKNYSVVSSWLYDGSNYMKFIGHLHTPIEDLKDIEGSFSYSYDIVGYDHFFELFLRYSTETEVRIRGQIHNASTVTLKIASTINIIRSVQINGIVKDTGHGLYNFEADLGSDSHYKLFGWFITKPVTLEMKFTEKDLKDELVSLSLNIKKENEKFQFQSLIQQLNDKIDIQGDFTAIASYTKLFNLKVLTSYQGYELLKLGGHVVSSDPRMTVLQLNGETSSEWFNTQFEWKCKAWLDGKTGLIDTSLYSHQVKAVAQVDWVWKWMENIWSNFNASYTYNSTTKDICSNLYLWNPKGKFGDMSFGSEISFNAKSWWFSTDMSIVAPNPSDMAFNIDVVLPHDPEVYSLIAKLTHAENYFNHIIKYSTLIQKKNYQFISEIKKETEIHGLIVAEATSFYLFDKFNVSTENNFYDVRNSLKTSLIQKELKTRVTYQKPSMFHKIIFHLCYPPPDTIVSADIQFESTNNILANLNCTTPLPNFSNATFFLKAETDDLIYIRFMKLQWHNKTALSNYTHVKTIEATRNVSNGVILVDFPLTTRHIGKLIYQYEDKDIYSSGFSTLEYNNDKILNGEYTKKQAVSHLSIENIYDIKVDNIYVPLGLLYLHNLTYFEKDSSLPFMDKKKAEIFKLHNTTHKFIGELHVEKSKNEENIKINAVHTVRKLSLVFKRGYKKILETYGQLILKPKVWAKYRLLLLSRDKESSSGNNVELNIAYPLRNFSLFGDYELAEKSLISNVGIISNDTESLFPKAKEIRASFNWFELSRDYNYKNLDVKDLLMASKSPNKINKHPLYYAQLMVYHPTFKKNLSLSGEFSRSDIEFYNLKSTLEYSTDKKKKLSISSVMMDRSTPSSKQYTFEAYTTHPSSRVNVSMLGVLRHDRVAFEVVKNMSYSRSYLPLQFWNAHLRYNKHNKEVELERESLRDLASLKGKYFYRNGVCRASGSVIKGKDIKVTGNFDFDIPKKETQLVINFTPDASERLHMDGFYKDHRNALFKVWRVYEEDSINDVLFFSRLNHSRLLQSSLVWRPDIRNDLASSAQTSWNYAWNYVLQTFEFWTDYMKNEASDTAYEIWSDAKPILHEFIEDLRDLRNIQDDIDYFKVVVNESFTENEFYMKDAFNMYLYLAEEISFRDKIGNLPKIFSELWEAMGETGETIRQSIIWVIENLKDLYAKALKFFTSLMKGEVLTQITHFISKVAGKYDKVIKDIHVSFIGYVEYLWCEGAKFFHSYWSKTLQVMEPTVIEVLHHLDSLVWEQSRKIFELFNRSQQELLQSDYFAKNTNLTRDVERFYKNITGNSFITNVKNYSKMLIGLINDKLFTNIPFGYELGQIANEIYGEVLELYKLPLINITIQTSQEFIDRVILVYNSFDVGSKVQRVIPVLYRHINDLSRNALSNNMKNRQSKTLFIFDPDKGLIKLEQKLPVPWHAFNETPNLAEIPEYKAVMEIQQLFSPSNITFWTLYYYYIPYIDPVNWLPPFKAHAIVIGTKHFITFNKRHFSLMGSCSYLLARDFVDDAFSLVLYYEPSGNFHTLVMVIGHETVSIDLSQDSVSLTSNSTVILPVDISGASIYYEAGVISVIGKKGFVLECNLKHDICTLFLEGWYFGKTAGLLGTMDSEAYNDFLSSDGKICTDVNEFADSWALDVSCASEKTFSYMKESDNGLSETCNSLYADKSSDFSVCYPVIDPTPFNDICKFSRMMEDSVCSSAVAYNQACSLENIPLRTPIICAKCPLGNGSDVALQEGDFTEFKDDAVPKSTDVVFIIEADSCNSNLIEKRSFQTLVTLLEDEFLDRGIKNNRYAVVAFGGNGIFSAPHTITIDSAEFTNAKLVTKYIEYVTSGITKEPGYSDIFVAISHASKQRFRPGVSKTFILVPCSDCDPRNMSLDYSVLHEVLTEKNAVLHILMNSDFVYEKLKMSKIFYGVDAEAAYTKNDFKAADVKGDFDLRKQIKLTKTTLGYCTPLAFETNGTIFSAKKLESENSNFVKKFISVFTRRVAKTAFPHSCQTCECTADTNGVDYVDCFPCFYPTPIYSDIGYYKDNNNFTLSFFQPFDQNSGGSETETETDISL
ncbi:apolipoprotein lipid transfer particle isoform X2 [Lycorma delicatula]|uniref:apolipoprotein lipid transfer particle isoform X2 n=1 Tax=Lycorma delicatula TaxID=130591 RepID=UPI003F514B26